MFANHQPPASYENQHSMLFDPRWMEVFMGHVRELDSYHEARKKLGKGGQSRGEKDEEVTPKPKAKVKAKGGGKLKDAKSKSQQEEAGN